MASESLYTCMIDLVGINDPYIISLVEMFFEKINISPNSCLFVNMLPLDWKLTRKHGIFVFHVNLKCIIAHVAMYVTKLGTID